MHVSRSRSSAILIAVLSACTASPEPSAPLGPTTASLTADNGIVIRAMGSGAVNLSTAGAGPAEFSFDAVLRSDGSVSGHFRQTRFRGTAIVDFIGVVTCVTVDANFPGRARIGARITANNSTDSLFLTTNHQVGDDVWFRVEDSGGGGSATDLSTTLGFAPTLVNTSEEYCALPFDGLPWWNPASIFPLKEGDIRVRQ